MADIWRLPEALGGGECKLHVDDKAEWGTVRVWVKVADDEAALVTIRGGLLTKARGWRR